MLCKSKRGGKTRICPSPSFRPATQRSCSPRAEHVCESSSPHTRGQSCLPRGEGNRESRRACHNAIYEAPRGCLQHPTGTARRGRARWGDLPSEVWVRRRLATASVNDGCVPLPPLVCVWQEERERAAPAGSAYHGSLSSFINLSGCRHRRRRRLPVWGSASGQASVWDPAAAAASDRASASDP